MALTREELKAILQEDTDNDEETKGRGRKSKGDDDSSIDKMIGTGRRSKGDDEDEDDKATGRRGRGRKSKGDDEDEDDFMASGDDDDEETKGRGRGRKSKGDDDDMKVLGRGRGRKSKGDDEDEDDFMASGRKSKGDDEDEDDKATGRRGRGRKSKGDDEDMPFVKASGRKSKGDDEDEDNFTGSGRGRRSKGDDEDEDYKATGRRGRGRKSKGAEGYEENSDNSRNYAGNYDPGVGRGEDDEDMPKASGRRKSKGDDDDEDVIKEGIALLFEDVDTGKLDPRFRKKAEVIFEAAVNTKTEMLREDILLEHAELLKEEMETLTECINNKLDEYLDEAITTWFKANEVGIDRSLKSEIMESLADDLSRVLREHNVDIPENKVNILESQLAKNEELEERLNESVNDTLKLRKLLLEYEKQDVIDTLSEGLSLNQADKFGRLCENLDVSDIKTFRKKASILLEQFGSVRGQDSDDVLNEDIEDHNPTAMERLADKITGFSGRRS